MKYNAIAKKLSMTTLAAAMLAAPAVNVFAATDVTIDTNRVGSQQKDLIQTNISLMENRMQKQKQSLLITKLKVLSLHT